jgi:hypothetical protein
MKPSIISLKEARAKVREISISNLTIRLESYVEKSSKFLVREIIEIKLNPNKYPYSSIFDNRLKQLIRYPIVIQEKGVKMNPSNFLKHPFDSVIGKMEAEIVTRNIMVFK